MDLHSKGFKKFMAMAYGLGGAVVILGALFKLMHWPGASAMLIIGLGTEAGIFVISAFEPLPAEEKHFDWELVYPELSGKVAPKKPASAEGVLTKKIDEMLAASKLDVKTIEKLTTSIQNFSAASAKLGDATAIQSTDQYSKQVASATSNLAKLNEMYAAQSESIKKQGDFSSAIAKKSTELSAQMDGLAKNISSLNNVYGGMLTAMGKK